MHVIWRRPDGFHGAMPADYRVIDVGTKAKIWVHITDKANFPFRISGGWQDEEASERLNQLVNLLSEPRDAWLSHLIEAYADSRSDQAQMFLDDLQNWLKSLQSCLKGDRWEQEIMEAVLIEIAEQIDGLTTDFTLACLRV